MSGCWPNARWAAGARAGAGAGAGEGSLAPPTALPGPGGVATGSGGDAPPSRWGPGWGPPPSPRAPGCAPSESGVPGPGVCSDGRPRGADGKMGNGVVRLRDMVPRVPGDVTGAGRWLGRPGPHGEGGFVFLCSVCLSVCLTTSRRKCCWCSRARTAFQRHLSLSLVTLHPGRLPVGS